MARTLVVQLTLNCQTRAIYRACGFKFLQRWMYDLLSSVENKMMRLEDSTKGFGTRETWAHGFAVSKCFT